MLRLLVFSVCFVLLTASANSASVPDPGLARPPLFVTAPHTDNRILRSIGVGNSLKSAPASLGCCKVCSIGKACGDTCISREKTCHVGVGCACDE